MAKGKPVIAVDLDEVLAQQNEAIRLYMNKHYGHNHTPQDYRQEGEYWGYWEGVLGIDTDEMLRRLDRYHNSGELAKLKPVPGALEAIKKLKSRYSLVVVTSRNEKYKKVSLVWLERHFPNVFEGVHFTSTRGDEASQIKAELTKEIGADYLIDDNLQHCISAAGAGLEALLFGDFGWSKTDKLPNGVARVKDWKEVLEHFDATSR